MLVDDRIIAEIIVRIGRHYNENIATRFLRPVFAQILSDIDLSRHIVDLTEHSEDFVLQGFHLEDLYYDILSMVRFVYLVRRDILPNLSSLTEANTKMATADKVYRNMAFSNLGPNVDILASLVLELYHAALEYDKKNAANGREVSRRIAGLADVERLLNTPIV
ncbi:MAG: hypothetical protein ACTTI6_01410 [Treponema sp.]|uniref:hypothetical protein n=1 Tax=Treponema sp. TaxID=166 RepID=UPI003FA2A56B